MKYIVTSFQKFINENIQNFDKSLADFNLKKFKKGDYYGLKNTSNNIVLDAKYIDIKDAISQPNDILIVYDKDYNKIKLFIQDYLDVE